jgi:CheY-like chemotaxis protein
MDGLTLARAIRANPLIARTRLVALTALGQPSSAEALKVAGIDTYLVKPVKQSRLFDCLVNLPSVKAPADRAVLLSNPLAAPAHSSRVDPQPGKARVLLAEDNHINQLIAVGLLRKLGYETDVVTNGLRALEGARSIPYDIIFMDCQMPEMDGYDAARAIRAHEQSSAHSAGREFQIYIIAITANAMEGDREKCLAAGMDDYLSKPIRLQELQAALERWKVSTQNRSVPLGAG